ncbi:hypothetical protein U1Q18_013395 [Sarracenia purpurea var. burkii]
MVQDRTDAQRLSGLISVWQPPKANVIKINFDAGKILNGNLPGLGAICPNYRGEIMAAMAIKWQGSSDMDFLEASTALKAMILIRESGFFNVHLEGDTLRLISGIKNPSLLSSTRLVISRICEGLSFFSSRSISLSGDKGSG